jgi:hypothetical protein
MCELLLGQISGLAKNLSPLNRGHGAATICSEAGIPISPLFPHSFCSSYLQVNRKR